jgi:hypothetical protein
MLSALRAFCKRNDELLVIRSDDDVREERSAHRATKQRSGAIAFSHLAPKHTAAESEKAARFSLEPGNVEGIPGKYALEKWRLGSVKLSTVVSASADSLSRNKNEPPKPIGIGRNGRPSTT